jgi:hypothetical protein
MPNTLIGVDITDTPGDSNTTDVRFQDSRGHRLGIIHEDHRGYQYMYVHANGAIAQYDVVAIDEAYETAPITKALADASNKVGVAPVAFADNDFGWVQVSGLVTMNVLASCAADVALYTSVTAGSLDDASASQTKIAGISLTTARGGSNGSAPGQMVIQPFAAI